MKKIGYIALVILSISSLYFLLKHNNYKKNKENYISANAKIDIDQMYEENNDSYQTNIEQDILDKTKTICVTENPIVDKEENPNLIKENVINNAAAILPDKLTILSNDFQAKSFSINEINFSDTHTKSELTENPFQINSSSNNFSINIENNKNENLNTPLFETNLDDKVCVEKNISNEEKNDAPLIENQQNNENLSNQQIIENVPSQICECSCFQETINPDFNENIPPCQNAACDEPSENCSHTVCLQKKLSEIIVANNKYTTANFLKKRIKLTPGEIINEKKLQEHLNFINLNSFRKVELVLDKQEDDKYNIDLICNDRFCLRPYIGVDNTGLKTLDRNRLFAGFNWNNAFGLDGILSYQYTSSFDFKKFQSHTGDWTIFLPWYNFLTFYGSYAIIDVDHMLPYIVKHNGSAIQASIRYDISLPIIGMLTHDLIFGFDFKRTDTNLLFSRFTALDDTFVNLTQFLIAYSLNWNNSFYTAKLLMELYFSLDAMVCDEENTKYNNLRPFAKNQYVYAKAILSNLFTLPKNFLLSFILSGQLSNENLLPSETLPLGGYNSIRGYYEREINTDSGLICNLELRSPSISLFGKRNICDSLKVIAFLDYGYGSLHAVYPFDKKNYNLFGFGPGLRYSINTYLTARLDWGIRGKKIAGTENPGNLIHFAVDLSY